MHEVLVIGGGLAGTMAALAAQQHGASVTLASRSWGATALSTGALDLAFTPAFSPRTRAAKTLVDHIQDIINHRPRHPYGLLGAAQTQRCLLAGYERLRSALADSAVALPALDLAQDNAAWPSSLGVFLPAATAFAGHRGVVFERSGQSAARIGVLQFRGDGYFDARRVSMGLGHDAAAFFAHPMHFEVVPVELDALAPPAMAAAFDDRALGQALVACLRDKIGGLTALIAPPVLGLHNCLGLRAYLADALPIPVIEALAHMPSVPGVRLQLALEAALDAAGVRRLGGVESIAPQAAETGATRFVAHTEDGLTLNAGAVVLCTGRFVAGGLQWDKQCHEQLFDLPVVTELGRLEEDSPHNVVRRTPVESHPLMTAGVKVNRSLMPMREGRVAAPGLFAAGMVLGGFASRYALCADGVALSSGFMAGQSAATLCREASI